VPTTPPGSYEKFSYLARPSKQVERKLIIEALQRLRFGGFPLQDYRYVGLGSVYYADFILFHKYLYIDDMVCAEASDIPRRMKFNKPYNFVRLRMGPVGNLIPRLDRDRRHFVWLDYDYGINEDIVQDVAAATNVLAPDSILLVTVDVELDHQVERGLSDRQRLRTLFAEFPIQFGRYASRKIERRDFTLNGFPPLAADILRNILQGEAGRREGFQFFQLFNYLYADGALMLSVGGIVGSSSTEQRIRQSNVRRLPFITGGAAPILVSVPPLTAREKDWLDQNVRDDSRVRDLRFELGSRALRNYRRYQRHYPTYHEALL
jgi:hypothetical protein